MTQITQGDIMDLPPEVLSSFMMALLARNGGQACLTAADLTSSAKYFIRIATDLNTQTVTLTLFTGDEHG